MRRNRAYVERLTQEQQARLVSAKPETRSRWCQDGVHHLTCEGCTCVCHAIAVHSATRRNDHHGSS